MSIIINVLNLPDRCSDCPCYNSSNSFCKADPKRRSTYEYRPFWCPASDCGDPITVSEYNKWYQDLNRASSFVSCIDHALQKSDENARMQLEVIGWSEETKNFLEEALMCYQQVMRSRVQLEDPHGTAKI